MLVIRCAVVTAIAMLLAVVPIADAHQANPDFRSAVRTISPTVDAVDAEVVNFDDSLELRNRSGRTLIVKGYRGEPYGRIDADGAVSVWEAVDLTGTYRWHDHRIHWMSRSLPPQVKDKDKRTKVFDWRVPIAVGGQPAAIAGTLTWVGEPSGGSPMAAAISLAAAALAGLGLVLMVRRRRRTLPAAAASRAALGARPLAYGAWSVLIALVLLLLLPTFAAAHAVLEESVPARGAHLQEPPKQVELRFGEPVEAAFGALRVFDQGGRRVDRGSAHHPAGRASVIAIQLDRGLRDGTYTATYRVISADSHPVSDGFVFTVGHGGKPAERVDQLIDAGGAGPATEVGFGIVRGLAYLALALAVGAAAFAALVWRPARKLATDAAEHAFAQRVGTIAIVAVALGVATSALGIVFQGAVASGTSFWSAFDSTIIRDVLHTRFGTVWGVRLLAWIAVSSFLVYLPAHARVGANPALATRPGGGVVVAPPPPAAPAPSELVPPRAALAILALLLGFLCVTPALAGHASTVSPEWLLVAANTVHVVSMAIWVGGVAMLLVALPAATRQLEPTDRTRLLAANVSRFSTVALIAVAGLVAGGTVQAIAELDALSNFITTPFGRAILIKIGIVVVLIGLGAWNRQRARPRLEALAADGATPGATGAALRRSLRLEIALMVAALGVTAALVSYAPALTPSDPFSASESIGRARMELTVDPARVGANKIHLYLFGRATGRQYDRVKELRVTARLPDRGIGPLPLHAAKAGPGHYVVHGADLAPAGDWRLTIAARVSAFDAYTARLDVPIR